MSPGKARHLLARRRTWLQARMEANPGRDLSRDRDEIEALDVALHLLTVVAPPVTPSADIARAAERSYERCRLDAERKKTTCICARCPVHGRKDAAE